MSRHDQREFGQVLGIGTGYSVTDVARYLQYSPESIIYWLRRSRQDRSRSYVTTRETGFMPTPTLNRHPPATSC